MKLQKEKIYQESRKLEKRRVPAPSKPFWLHQNSTSWKEARVIQEESKKLQTTLPTIFFPCLGTWLIPYPLVSSEDKYFTAQEIKTLVTCLLPFGSPSLARKSYNPF